MSHSLNFSLISGIFSIFCVHSIDFGYDLFPIHTGSLVVLRRQHLCMGAVCVAHRARHMSAHCLSLVTFCIYRSVG